MKRIPGRGFFMMQLADTGVLRPLKPIRFAEADLPDDVYIPLVRSLFDVQLSLYTGLVGAVLISLKVSLDARNPTLYAITIFLALTGVARILVQRRFDRIEPATLTRDDAKGWERRFAIFAECYCAGLGALLFVTFQNVDSVPDHLLVVAICTGTACLAPARNAGRPRIAITQLFLLLVPLTAAALLRLESSYALLAMLYAIFLMATIDIVRTTYANMLRLKLTTREKTALAASLASKHELLDAALGNMSHGLCLLDSNYRLVMSNTRFQDLLDLPDALVTAGVSFRDIVGNRLADIFHAGATEGHGKAVDDHWSPEASTSSVMTLSNGRSLELSRQCMADGGTVVLFDDVTERNRAEARIAHLASHDALTDIPNRTAFNARIKYDLDHLSPGASVNLFCLDLDRFKAVNDKLGHAAGDAVLCEVTRRIAAILDPHMMLARIGGDEFVIVGNSLDQPEMVRLAEHVIAVVSVPYHLDGGQADIGVSIGAVRTTDRSTRPHDLLQAADLALYDAKDQGRGTVCLYRPGIPDHAGSRRQTEMDLPVALQRGDFILHYQPQFDLAEGCIVGVEALLRWQHPTQGLIAADDFIQLAEETGLILALSEWVLRQACEDAATWPMPVRVAVNVSPAQFRNCDLVAVVKSALQASGLAPARLYLEITEPQVFRGNDGMLATLKALRSMGIRISSDDFGAGYATLSSLRAIPFDSIKIDRSFVRNIADDPLSQPIVRSIVALGRDIGVPTVAEGVETQEQLDLVRALGCREAQGFLLAGPMPAAEILSLLLSKSVRDASAA